MNNVTRKYKAVEGCDQCKSIHQSLSNLKKDDCICYDASDYEAFFVIGNGLEIEGYDSKGNKIGPVQNAWGASTGSYKITLKQDTDVSFRSSAVSIPPFSYEGQIEHYIVVFKKNWEGQIHTTYDVRKDGSTIEYEYLYFYAPDTSAVKVTYETENNANCAVDPSVETSEKADTVSGQWVSLTVANMEADEVGEFTAELDVTSSVTNPPSYYPDKIFEVKRDMIFSAALPDYEFLDVGGGLSGGAIAGIVIACVVVVGVVVFCVVWFVVLKKSCPCGGSGKESAEA